jgi:small subunit ribosomal protein S16
LAVRIRLTRMGRKKRPFYRIVVMHGASPRDGRSIDQIGIYDPMTDPATIQIDEEKAEMWLRRGAQPSDTVADFLKKRGVLDRIKGTKTEATG